MPQLPSQLSLARVVSITECSHVTCTRITCLGGAPEGCKVAYRTASNRGRPPDCAWREGYVLLHFKRNLSQLLARARAGFLSPSCMHKHSRMHTRSPAHALQNKHGQHSERARETRVAISTTIRATHGYGIEMARVFRASHPSPPHLPITPPPHLPPLTSCFARSAALAATASAMSVV